MSRTQSSNSSSSYEEEEEQDNDPDENTKAHLKQKITIWMDNDDKIKELSDKIKKYRKDKKTQEEIILDIIEKVGLKDKKLDVWNGDNELRGRVYRHKSITRGTLNNDIIKEALMEVMGNEVRVNELIKKIESKRKPKQRYYLKRTRGIK